MAYEPQRVDATDRKFMPSYRRPRSRGRPRKRRRRRAMPRDKRYRAWPKTQTGKLRRHLLGTVKQLSAPIKFMHFRWRGAITAPAGGTDHVVAGAFNINKCNDGLGQTGAVARATFVVHDAQAHGHKEALDHGFDLVRCKSFKMRMELWNPGRDLGTTMMFAYWFSESSVLPADPADDNAGRKFVDQLKLDPKVRWKSVAFFLNSHERGTPGTIYIDVPNNFALTKKLFHARPPATNVDQTAEIDLSTGNVITARDLDEPLVNAQASTDPRKDAFLIWVWMRESGEAISGANTFTLIPDITRYVRVSKADLGLRAVVPISTLNA